MNANLLYNAIGELNDEIIQDAEVAQPVRVKIRWRGLVAAVLAIALLAIPVRAEVINGYVSNLLAPLFGNAKTDIVDKIGKPIGASATADGYTLTADAVIGDQYNVAIVYTLSRNDGQPIPEGTHFAQWDTDIIWGASGAGSLKAVKNEEDPSKLHFVESWSRESRLIGRYVSAYFSQLQIYNENGEDTPIAEGPWELNYTLRYEDTSVSIPIKDLKVTDADGDSYRIDEAIISPVGLRINGTILDPSWRGEPPFKNFTVAIKTTEGAVILLEDHSSGGGYAEGDKTADFRFNAMFEIPMELKDIEALVICGVEYPLTVGG